MIFNRKKNKLAQIYIQDTLTNTKRIFSPIEQGKVRMYNCGPTVYSEQHIGNMRAAVFADLLRRMFEYNKYTVQQVINITDVGHLTSDADSGEDKMEKKAKESGETAKDISKKITKIYLDDLKDLGVDIDSIKFPYATDYIDAQRELTKTLIEKGYAYIIDRGVAFDTSKFKKYGELGNINIDELKEGARIEADSQKRNPTDFWLWKLSDKPGERQQEWDSPWGVGFPGWHIECTAMSRAILGKQLDVHTGGIEHIPIHHNNEIAQSEALSGKKFVNYWMHNAHLMLDGKKISKSLGNVVHVRHIKDKGYNPLALRYLFLQARYNVEQNFTWEALGAADTALKKLRKYVAENDSNDGMVDKVYVQTFTKNINDNLNTPKALALLWDLQKDPELLTKDKVATILDFDKMLGLQLKTSKEDSTKLQVEIDNTPIEVLSLLKERKNARKQKDWSKSDELRDKVLKLGYTIIDKGDEQKLSTL